MSTSPSRTLIALCIVASLLLAACASSDDTSVSDAGTIAATEETAAAASTPATDDMVREDPAMDAELTVPASGTLGVAEIEGGCAYVEIDGTRYELLADPGADFAVDPANGVVADAEGTVIARAGEQITVDGVVDPGIVTFCQIGPVLVATSITAG